MYCDYLSVKAWLKMARKDLKKKVISKSEFNRVRKIAGYNSFLDALESSLKKSEKAVDMVWCKDFVVLSLNLIESMRSDVFFSLGFKDGVWDFSVDFLPDSWACQMHGGKVL